MSGKTALVIEGGAMRGIFSAGITDQFLEEDFNPFDMVIGVSAGSINAAAWLAEYKGRNLEVYTNYSLQPGYISFKNFLKGHHFIDLDWLWKVTEKELPINTDILFKKNIDFEIGFTSNANGEAFFLNPNAENISHYLKASCTIPFFYRNYLEIEGQVVSDGGVAAPIPVERAYEKGADKIMVLRSRPESYRMSHNLGFKIAKLVFSKHKGLAKAIENRHEVYNKSIDFIHNPPQGVKVIEVCPPEHFKTGRFTQDYKTLIDDYKIGKEMGKLAIEKFKKTCLIK
ncbi:patatin family protein [Ancylomarina sp. 16SWW S1-10-2]|uniref:patatin-like phospholipase family protein n=1 Tax=Ancylomarina sp. 16SWW S1-10-2 TaxID=2499681 RepID=UPI0012AD859F|nr:patatin family protein [Ancylomarina sp. 16SWW S1-10-2]MRT94564.1 patatin family protein [Ancylomarina sp. 16SWW S1-10-2]